jgi:hypothetical protein
MFASSYLDLSCVGYIAKYLEERSSFGFEWLRPKNLQDQRLLADAKTSTAPQDDVKPELKPKLFSPDVMEEFRRAFNPPQTYVSSTSPESTAQQWNFHSVGLFGSFSYTYQRVFSERLPLKAVVVPKAEGISGMVNADSLPSVSGSPITINCPSHVSGTLEAAADVKVIKEVCEHQEAGDCAQLSESALFFGHTEETTGSKDITLMAELKRLAAVHGYTEFEDELMEDNLLSSRSLYCSERPWEVRNTDLCGARKHSRKPSKALVDSKMVNDGPIFPKRAHSIRNNQSPHLYRTREYIPGFSFTDQCHRNKQMGKGTIESGNQLYNKPIPAVSSPPPFSTPSLEKMDTEAGGVGTTLPNDQQLTSLSNSVSLGDVMSSPSSRSSLAPSSSATASASQEDQQHQGPDRGDSEAIRAIKETRTSSRCFWKSLIRIAKGAWLASAVR